MEDKEITTVADGKTKTFLALPQNALLLKQKDVLTAGNGLRKVKIPEIGNYKALQNDFIQRFLEKHGIPTSYIGLLGDNLAAALRAEMMALELVERNESAKGGSWELRNPNSEFPAGGVSEIFDKRSIVLPGDGTAEFMEESEAVAKYGKNAFADPYVNITADGRWEFYDQKRPITAENRLMTTGAPYPPEHIQTAQKYSKLSFNYLTRGIMLAGRKVGYKTRLIDDKTEYGYVGKNYAKNIVLSDDLTLDAMRLEIIKDGELLPGSKQTMRDLDKAGADDEQIRAVMPEVYKRGTDILSHLDEITL
jgi:phosphoribosylaminoimidazole-succinocarboxamide synthase